MEKTAASVMIDRPAEEVWRFVTDVENMKKYEPGILEAKVTSTGPVGVGSTAMSRRSDGTYTFRVVEYEPNQRFFLEITSEKGKGSKEGLVLEPVGGKTKLGLVWDLKLGGFYSLMRPIVSRSLKKNSETLVSNIKRMMESEAKP